jgi:hypothetical protein
LGSWLLSLKYSEPVARGGLGIHYISTMHALNLISGSTVSNLSPWPWARMLYELLLAWTLVGDVTSNWAPSKKKVPTSARNRT